MTWIFLSLGGLVLIGSHWLAYFLGKSKQKEIDADNQKNADLKAREEYAKRLDGLRADNPGFEHLFIVRNTTEKR